MSSSTYLARSSGSNGTSADDRPVDPGQVGREQRGLAAVAAEQLDHGDALVRPGRGAQLVDELHAAGDRGREADAVVGAEDVVVHRLGHGQDLHALAGQPLGVRQGVVAADGDQPVQAEPLDHGQAVAGEVERPLGLELALPGQEPGHVGGRDLGRVGPAGVQEGPAGAVDGAHLALGQRLHAVVLGLVGVQVVVEQPGPAAPQPHHLVAAVGGGVHQRLDAGVEPGNVAATGEHADPGHSEASRACGWP